MYSSLNNSGIFLFQGSVGVGGFLKTTEEIVMLENKFGRLGCRCGVWDDGWLAGIERTNERDTCGG